MKRVVDLVISILFLPLYNALKRALSPGSFQRSEKDAFIYVRVVDISIFDLGYQCRIISLTAIFIHECSVQTEFFFQEKLKPNVP